MYTFVYRTFIKFIFFCWGQALDAIAIDRNDIAADVAIVVGYSLLLNFIIIIAFLRKAPMRHET